MKRTSLLIMAAGIGARYGAGIKQLESVGLRDELIIDYSIHDAIEAGFNRIIFVIRRDIEADFRERIGSRIEAVCSGTDVEILYAFQSLEDIPAGFSVPEGRKKPWGTCQAVLAAKALIDGPFMVINADDYYGQDIYRTMYGWLNSPREDNEIAMAGFILKNTLSDNGGVTRGICSVDRKRGLVLDVAETKNVVRTASGAEADGKILDPDSYVSMNMWAFPARDGEKPVFLDTLEEGFSSFFGEGLQSDPLNAECLLPVLIGRLLREGEYTVKVLETHDRWFGITYREDLAAVQQSFRKLIDRGIYTPDLYSDLK